MTDADRLRDAIARLGLSQRGLARELCIDERVVRRWCAGEEVPAVIWLAIEALEKRRIEASPPTAFPSPCGDHSWTITDSNFGPIDPPVTITLRREPKP